MSATSFKPADFIEVQVAFVSGGAVRRERAGLRAVGAQNALLVGSMSFAEGSFLAIREDLRAAVFAKVLRTVTGSEGSAGSHVRAVSGLFEVRREPLAPPCMRALGLAWPCDAAAVKSAYRRLAKRLHPDGGGSVAAFGRLCAEYEAALELVAA
jgi:hypothetical protein